MENPTKKLLLGLYLAAAILTLFQINVRSGPCAAAGDCASSYAKALVRSAIWPASWVAYLKG